MYEVKASLATDLSNGRLPSDITKALSYSGNVRANYDDGCQKKFSGPSKRRASLPRKLN